MVIIDKAHRAAYAGCVLVSCFEVTDKGTPGVILGRKAKAFEIFDFLFAIFYLLFWVERQCAQSKIENRK